MSLRDKTTTLRNAATMAMLAIAFMCGNAGQLHAQKDAKESSSPLVGSWKWMQDDGDNRVRCELVVVEKDGKLVGSYEGTGDNKAKVTDLKCEDGKVAITVNLKDESKIQLKGKLKGKRITGKMTTGDGEVDWKATRFVSLKEAAATWKLSFTTPDGVTREPEIVLSEKDGEPHVEFGDGDDSEASDGEITNVKFEDGVLTFDVALDFNGAALELEYDLEIDGDEVEGTMYFEIDGGPSGDVEVTGTRG